MDTAAAPLNQFLADELGRRSEAITRRWLEQLTVRLGVRPRRVFPTEALLDHVPEIIGKIAQVVRSPGTNLQVHLVVDELKRMASLRREQGYDIQEVLYELELLGSILYDEIKEGLRAYNASPAHPPADPTQAAEAAERVGRALLGLGTITAGVFKELDTRQRGKLSDLLGDFGHALSHELREPLFVITLSAQMLARENVAGDEKQRILYTDGIRKAVRDLETLINDVRALALGGGGPERREPLAGVVGACVEEVRFGAEKCGVSVELDGAVPDAEVDATRVELALVNLVGNAVKYSDPGKPKRWVRIAARRDEVAGGLRVEVADNGLGIPQSAQGGIFARFVRAHPDVAEGSGLGLFIAREAVEQLGGTIRFESTVGEGTRFFFTIPGAPAKPAQ